MKMDYSNCEVSSDLGKLILVVSDEGIARVFLPNQEATINNQEPTKAAEHIALDFSAQLQSYLDGRQQAFDLPLDWGLVKTDFQKRVLEALTRVSYGQTVSYNQLAARSGAIGASRAVGTALANNPLPLLVPCHRVIRENGEFGSYAGGADLKQRLLHLEQAQ